MYAHTSSDKARFQPKLSAAGFVCSTVFWYTALHCLNAKEDMRLCHTKKKKICAFPSFIGNTAVFAH